jgi:phosphoglycolate phosphatase-like HAD superfamily hydrolase
VRNAHNDPALDLSSYDCVIWDFDGTLFNLRVDWIGLKQKIQQTLQVTPGYTAPQKLSIENLVSEARRLNQVQSVFDIITSAELQGLVPWEAGLQPVPTKIFLHLKTVSIVVSNNMSGTITAFLRRVGAAEVVFVSRDRVNHPKPSPEGLYQLGAYWQGKRAVLVGDSEIDQQLAHTCGIPFIPVQSLATLVP